MTGTCGKSRLGMGMTGTGITGILIPSSGRLGMCGITGICGRSKLGMGTTGTGILGSLTKILGIDGIFGICGSLGKSIDGVGIIGICGSGVLQRVAVMEPPAASHQQMLPSKLFSEQRHHHLVSEPNYSSRERNERKTRSTKETEHSQ